MLARHLMWIVHNPNYKLTFDGGTVAHKSRKELPREVSNQVEQSTCGENRELGAKREKLENQCCHYFCHAFVFLFGGNKLRASTITLFVRRLRVAHWPPWTSSSSHTFNWICQNQDFHCTCPEIIIWGCLRGWWRSCMKWQSWWM